MIRRLISILCVAALLSSCSKREQSAEDEAEWAGVEAMNDNATVVPASGAAAANERPSTMAGEEIPAEEFEYFIRKLAEMKSVQRGVEEALLTSETLVFDYDGGYVRMDQNVVVEDDQGTLKTESLIGRFNVADKLVVERIEVKGGVDAVSGERTARAEEAIYDHLRAFAWLSGGATLTESTNAISGDDLRIWFSKENELKRAEAEGTVSIRYGEVAATGAKAFYDAEREYARLEGRGVIAYQGNTISGERFQFWTAEGERKVICEPNVVMEGAADAFAVDGVQSSTNGLTEIRGNRLTFDERKRMVELVGSVRVRDPRAAMNCDKMRLHLKEDDEIDWIEALGEVIIQIGEIEGLPENVEYVKALAERATYRAAENKFSLENEPKVKVGPNVMTGERIDFWVEPWRMICEPNARVLFYLDEEIKAKFLKDLNE